MEILSCGADTQLHSFPQLDQLSSSAHVDSNGSDCIFLGSPKLFVRVNKNSGIELLRIKDGDQTSAGGVLARSITSVKKMMIENLYCVACPKTSGKNEIAIGLTSGTVRFMDYKKANFTKRFPSDRITNGVTFMDFNTTDDFLASVFENGLVNVYGMKTNSKLHTLSFDKFTTTKVRFHPTKRFQIAVASYEGGVRLYDTQSKKTLFYDALAHTAPCRDVAMVETYPDYLFSVGYDGIIKVFDARRSQTASQINSNYPFESLAIAEDGHHFAVGNLKGFVYGYDLRFLKDPLNMKKIHQSSVTSVVFVPLVREGSSRRSMIELDESKKVNRAVRVSEGSGQLNGAPENRPKRQPSIELQRQPQQETNHEQHDSFIGEIDLFLQRREAPLDCLSRLSSSSRLSVESRNSMQMAGNNLMGFLEDLSGCNIDAEGPTVAESSREPEQQVSGSPTEPEPSVNDSFVNVDRLLKRVKSDNWRPNASAGDRLHRKGITTDNLENIREEGSDVGEGGNEATSNNEKLIVRRVLAESQQENKPKTPQQETRTLSCLACETAPEVQAAEQQPSPLSCDIAELRKTMLEQFQLTMHQNLEAEEEMKKHMWKGVFNLWLETQRKLELIEQSVNIGFGLLLTRDEFAQQFLSTRAENEKLKKMVKDLEEQIRRQKL